MLLELHVKNFTIIDDMKIEFSKGLNIITGETGAGKSIIIDAISLLLGARASTDYIKTGKEKATIHGIFYIGNKSVKQLLKDLDMSDWNENSIIISREIYTDTGKNICRLNSRPVTLGILKEVGQYLVDIHGQHEHQSLLDVDKHIDLLDMFGGEEILSIRRELKAKYVEYKKIIDRLQRFKEVEQNRKQRLEYLKYQDEELKKANLTTEEEKNLITEKNILSNSENLFLSASAAYELLYHGNEETFAAYDTLSKSIEELDKVKGIDSKNDKIVERLQDIFFKIEDISEELRAYRDSIIFDQEYLNEIESRLDYLGQLKRKYDKDIGEIISYHNEIKNEIDELVNLSESNAKLIDKKDKIEKELIILSTNLSDKRKSVSNILENEITDELSELKMDKTKFKIDFKREESTTGIKIGEEYINVTDKGIDLVEFKISTNPGEPLKPLSKIISGGEMSRIMLALKTILARVDNISTLIFDEIDSGIGGITAQSVSRKLLAISKCHQTICVTHLPQIASMAHNHLYIEKIIKEKLTSVKITKLCKKQRVTELARMLEGSNITDITLRHAKQMIAEADKLNKEANHIHKNRV
ncbi:MAG TPA: DNA repair protein RecN [Thermoanaerobacterales bacterium]|nr:DNA repair protein RecN [Thermoanaerobacterales bacterium]